MMVAMPVEMALVNQRVLKSHWFAESILMVLPCFLLFFALTSQETSLQWVLGLSAGILAFFTYLRHPAVRLKLLLE